MHCLDCGYDLRELSEPRCPECGRGFDPKDRMSWGAADSPSIIRVTRWLGRLALLFAGLTSIVTLYHVGMGYPAVFMMILSGVIGGGLVLSCLLPWLGFIAKVPQARENFVSWAICFCFLLWLSALTSWPLKVTFSFSQPKFMTLVTQVQNGQQPQLPTRAGLWTIHFVEQRDGCWVFSTDGQSLYFVYQMKSNKIDMNFNTFSSERIDGNWHLVIED